MDSNTYQMVALGTLALTGVGTCIYLDAKRKDTIDYFCNIVVPTLVGRTNALDANNKKLFDGLVNKLNGDKN